MVLMMYELTYRLKEALNCMTYFLNADIQKDSAMR